MAGQEVLDSGEDLEVALCVSTQAIEDRSGYVECRGDGVHISTGQGEARVGIQSTEQRAREIVLMNQKGDGVIIAVNLERDFSPVEVVGKPAVFIDIRPTAAGRGG